MKIGVSKVCENILRPQQAVNIKDSYNENAKKKNNINLMEWKNKKEETY